MVKDISSWLSFKYDIKYFKQLEYNITLEYINLQ